MTTEHIACIGSNAKPIVTELVIGNSCIRAIVDTGATASFIPKFGKVLTNNRATTKKTLSRARTANNSTMTLKEEITLLTRPRSAPIEPVEATFLIMPQKDSIMGYDAIMGLNLIKAFNIKVALADDKMRAYIGDTIIW